MFRKLCKIIRFFLSFYKENCILFAIQIIDYVLKIFEINCSKVPIDFVYMFGQPVDNFEFWFLECLDWWRFEKIAHWFICLDIDISKFFDEKTTIWQMETFKIYDHKVFDHFHLQWKNRFQLVQYFVWLIRIQFPFFWLAIKRWTTMLANNVNCFRIVPKWDNHVAINVFDTHFIFFSIFVGNMLFHCVELLSHWC